jgi:hypothetical protein
MWVRETLGCAVVLKAVTVESRKPFSSAEPEKTTRIGNDSMDGIVCEAVGSCVDLSRKALCMSQRR